jgi:mono/diheme cytochrome c family protein
MQVTDDTRRWAGLLLVVCGVMGAMRAQTPDTTETPPGNATNGRTVYAARCVECHGESGKGDGPGAYQLTPRPRDFTLARYKIRTTETGSLPTDDDLIRSV